MLYSTELAFYLPLESHPYYEIACGLFGRQHLPKSSEKIIRPAFLCCNSEFIKKKKVSGSSTFSGVLYLPFAQRFSNWAGPSLAPKMQSSMPQHVLQQSLHFSVRARPAKATCCIPGSGALFTGLMEEEYLQNKERKGRVGTSIPEQRSAGEQPRGPRGLQEARGRGGPVRAPLGPSPERRRQREGTRLRGWGGPTEPRG